MIIMILIIYPLKGGNSVSLNDLTMGMKYSLFGSSFQTVT